MTIGIDARLYGAINGGIGRYTANLIKQLENIDSTNQYFVFLSQNNFSDYQPQNKNFKKVLADFKVYSWQEQLLLPLLLKKHHLDLVHFTHFNAPILYRGRFIVTIHDLIISHYPDSRATTLNPIIYRIKLFFYRLVIKIIFMRAKKIITVSNYSKKDIIKLLKVPPDKISVTYEGVDLPLNSNIDGNKLKAELGIDGDFLLYVGSAYPHKNLDRLILAFKKVLEDKKNLQLVLVGRKNYFYEKLAQLVDEQNLTKAVILTDYLNDEELAVLYQSAKLYVFPSLLEGFGLPALEAQSYGLPVLSSRNSSLEEILGESASYFNETNIEDMANTISDLLNDPNRLNELKIKGYKNTGRYSWANCAQKTKQAYNKIVLKK